MTLRVNARQDLARCSTWRRCSASGIEAPAVGSTGVSWASRAPVHELPGFDDGEVSVQDAAAQLAAPLLLQGSPAQRARRRAALRVLDACAAPGGKTAHLLELADARRLGAGRRSGALRAHRTRRCSRLGLQRAGAGRRRRASRPPGGTAGRSTPSCSTRPAPPRASCGAIPTCAGCAARATSTQLAAMQARLLDALWPLLAPGGRLLYCTCSVFRAEGEAQIANVFCAQQRRRFARPRPAIYCPKAGQSTMASRTICR